MTKAVSLLLAIIICACCLCIAPPSGYAAAAQTGGESVRAAGFSSQTLFGLGGVKVSAVDFGLGGSGCYAVKLLIENNSEKDIDVDIYGIYIRRVYMEGALHASVAADSRGEAVYYFSEAFPAAAGLDSFDEIRLSGRVTLYGSIIRSYRHDFDIYVPETAVDTAVLSGRSGVFFSSGTWRAEFAGTAVTRSGETGGECVEAFILLRNKSAAKRAYSCDCMGIYNWNEYAMSSLNQESIDAHGTKVWHFTVSADGDGTDMYPFEMLSCIVSLESGAPDSYESVRLDLFADGKGGAQAYPTFDGISRELFSDESVAAYYLGGGFAGAGAAAVIELRNNNQETVSVSFDEKGSINGAAARCGTAADAFLLEPESVSYVPLLLLPDGALPDELASLGFTLKLSSADGSKVIRAAEEHIVDVIHLDELCPNSADGGAGFLPADADLDYIGSPIRYPEKYLSNSRAAVIDGPFGFNVYAFHDLSIGLEGKHFEVPDGTAVTVIAQQEFFSCVIIPSMGKAGWINNDYLDIAE